MTIDELLDRLAGEVLGSFDMWEPELRRVMGNTNFSIIRDLASEARKELHPMMSADGGKDIPL